ncbi:hypothetical protein PFICI_11197 [Pestalotiopsis fici W106-1]|uniref:Amino acid permease/ SLC12A domain-containing protein n=1 Tax=Pestalotiopsis fici (strain W106-1 / CGMCC3.15140) TaxID=1229662 RepID=W3WTX1_PESFW|nr:uncharacterized protein PFICI_11197 [Pestalotiopsis fici W106-1]ETS77323.1 hypothetical protein PFICI_11197 [Pestalotiopsis fici W106-1]
MIEEIPNAAVEGPKIMVYCEYIGISTGFIFIMILLFVSGGQTNTTDIITSPAGPLLQILNLATDSRAGAVCLLMFPLMCLVFAGTACLTTSSRMIFAFARDGGLPASRTWWKTHPTLQVPLNALYLNALVVVVFGCIYLGSTVAFNAILSATVVALGISYGIPIAVNLVCLRRKLPERSFTLPAWLGWTVNIIYWFGLYCGYYHIFRVSSGSPSGRFIDELLYCCFCRSHNNISCPVANRRQKEL